MYFLHHSVLYIALLQLGQPSNFPHETSLINRQNFALDARDIKTNYLEQTNVIETKYYPLP